MGSFIGDLFDITFTRFLTTKWIKLLYFIGMAVLVLEGIVLFIMAIMSFSAGGSQGAGVGILFLIMAFVGPVLGLIGLRIYLELVVVLFRIEEHTRGLAPIPPGTPVAPTL